MKLMSVERCMKFRQCVAVLKVKKERKKNEIKRRK